MSKIISAIDIGSNAMRMMIAEVSFKGQQPHLIKTIKKIRSPVRLGKDVFLDQPISNKTLQESLDTFKHFKNINEKYKVSQCRAVATSALRESKNKDEFVKLIQKNTGIKIEIIDGIEEAQLIHLAVTRELDLTTSSNVLIDIGGGSVEVTFSKKGKLTSSKSFPIGTVRILDYLIKRNLTEENLKVIIGDFITPLTDYINKNRPHNHLSFAIGTGGNLECMARLKLDLLKKIPNTYLSLKELVTISDKIKNLSIQDRIQKLHLRPDRADVILPAILIVKTIMRHAEVDKIVIPCVGLRNGILWSMIL
ncbi:MAG: hypothetical protein KDD45_03155 [Bdellovibrionales bacterium]|nr:hypothetical protein [Bdellovibrionales bacterium]